MEKREDYLCDTCSHERVYHGFLLGCTKDIHSSTTFSGTRRCSCRQFTLVFYVVIAGVEL